MLINLKFEIIKSQKSSAQVGLECKIIESHMSGIVTGKRDATEDQKKILCDYFKKDKSYLFEKNNDL